MEAIGGVRVLVVDDGSGEAEAAALRKVVNELRPDYPCLLPLLELPENQGKGGAVRAGWLAAAPEAEWLGFVDADGSCSAAETTKLIQLARKYREALPYFNLPVSDRPPALIASRIKILGRRVERQLKRHLLGRIYATLTSTLLNIPVYDSQCGLKLLPRSAFEAVTDRLQVSGFAFDAELIASLLDQGTPVLEIPIDWHEVAGGKVRLLRDSWRMARDIWRIRQRRAKNPG